MLWRLHAQRLLVERGQADIVPQLVSLLENQDVDAIGLNVGAIHALRVLQGLSAKAPLKPEVIASWSKALKHPSSGVRSSAAVSLPPTSESVEAIVTANLLLDAQPQVRLAACLALADAAPTAVAGKSLFETLVSAESTADRWVPDAITAAAARNDLAFLRACAESTSHANLNETALAVIQRVAEHFARGENVEALESLLTSLAGTQPSIATAIIGGLSKGMSEERRPKLTASLEDALVKLHEHSDQAGKLRVITLAGRWGSQCLKSQGDAIAKALLATAEDEEATADARIAA